MSPLVYLIRRQKQRLTLLVLVSILLVSWFYVSVRNADILPWKRKKFENSQKENIHEQFEHNGHGIPTVLSDNIDSGTRKTAYPVTRGNHIENLRTQQLNLLKSELTKPTLLWWAPVSGMSDHDIACDQFHCAVSVNRSVQAHLSTTAMLFYGSVFDLTDLPMPRSLSQVWALKHEESPKNNDFLFSHSDVMEIFNYTSTFKRESDYPVTTQHLHSIEWLQSKKFLVPLATKNKMRSQLAPVLFIQSDCDVPSDRETHLKLLQSHIEVDSYGKCSNNRKLPEQLKFKNDMSALDKEEFFRFVAQYKFTLAMENAVCDDYITEKLWRTLHVGSVPIVFGSPKIKDFLPNNKSAIVVDDFENVKDLATFVKHLDLHDDDYAQYMTFKEHNGVTNQFLLDTMESRDWSVFEFPTAENKKKYYSHFQGFECFVCKKVHENLNFRKHGQQTLNSVASVKHYGCPIPGRFDENGRYQKHSLPSPYANIWSRAKRVGQAFRHYYDRGLSVTQYNISHFVERSS